MINSSEELGETWALKVGIVTAIFMRGNIRWLIKEIKKHGFDSVYVSRENQVLAYTSKNTSEYYTNNKPKKLISFLEILFSYNLFTEMWLLDNNFNNNSNSTGCYCSG